MNFQNLAKIDIGSEDPTGRPGIAVITSSYAERKSQNDGIALRVLDQEDSVSLYKTIEAFPDSDRIFYCVRGPDDLLQSEAANV